MAAKSRTYTGLEVFMSNNMETLAAISAGIMRMRPLSDPFVKENVVVMNTGMSTYLSQCIATQNHIEAMCDYCQIWQLIYYIHRLCHPSASKVDLYEREHLTWNIFAQISAWENEQGMGLSDASFNLEDEGLSSETSFDYSKVDAAFLGRDELFSKLRQYLQNDRYGDKAYELSSRIADTFDQYQMYRPQWIMQWNNIPLSAFDDYENDPDDPSNPINIFIEEQCRSFLQHKSGFLSSSDSDKAQRLGNIKQALEGAASANGSDDLSAANGSSSSALDGASDSTTSDGLSFDAELSDEERAQRVSKERVERVRTLFKSNVWQIKLWCMLRFNLELKTPDGKLNLLDPDGVELEWWLNHLDRSQVIVHLISVLKKANSLEDLYELLVKREQVAMERGNLEAHYGSSVARLGDFKAFKRGFYERVFIFGVSALPRIVVEFLQALAKHCSVNIMLLNPCQEYWADIAPSYRNDFDKYVKNIQASIKAPAEDLKKHLGVFAKGNEAAELIKSKKEEQAKLKGKAKSSSSVGENGSSLKAEKSSSQAARGSKKGSAKANKAVRHILEIPAVNLARRDFDDAGERVEGHPLLLSYGKQGRDNLSMLLDRPDMPNINPAFSAPDMPTEFEYHEVVRNNLPTTEVTGGTLLGYIQNQLLTLKQPRERYLINAHDKSLVIHSCHTKRREIEVLHDAILECFNQAKIEGRTLKPRDIVVMVPAINEYAPHIEAVFGSGSKNILSEDYEYINAVLNNDPGASVKRVLEDEQSNLFNKKGFFERSKLTENSYSNDDSEFVARFEQRHGIATIETDLATFAGINDGTASPYGSASQAGTASHKAKPMDVSNESDDYDDDDYNDDNKPFDPIACLSKEQRRSKAIEELLKIKALKGAHAQERESYIPFVIADQTEHDTNTITQALLKLLEIGSTRVTSSVVIDLLSEEAIAKRFGLDKDDVDRLSSYLSDAKIYWGLDDEDIAEFSQIELPGSFEKGIDRIVLGTLVGDNDELPCFSEIEGSNAIIIGKFNEFLKALKELRQRFTPSLRLSHQDWADSLQNLLIARFFDTSSETRDALKPLTKILDDLKEIFEHLVSKPEINLPVFAATLKQGLTAQTKFQRFLGEKVNFCSLVPMRAVPFEHVFILGLNDSDFPREDRTPGFNLMSNSEIFERGDRSRAIDDRYLFLEALLSARRSIYFSYLGQSPNDKTELNSSIVLSELLHYIMDTCGIEGVETKSEVEREKLVEKRLVVQEHLNTYSAANYQADTYKLYKHYSADEQGQEQNLGQEQDKPEQSHNCDSRLAANDASSHNSQASDSSKAKAAKKSSSVAHDDTQPLLAGLDFGEDEECEVYEDEILTSNAADADADANADEKLASKKANEGFDDADVDANDLAAQEDDFDYENMPQALAMHIYTTGNDCVGPKNYEDWRENLVKSRAEDGDAGILGQAQASSSSSSSSTSSASCAIKSKEQAKIASSYQGVPSFKRAFFNDQYLLQENIYRQVGAPVGLDLVVPPESDTFGRDVDLGKIFKCLKDPALVFMRDVLKFNLNTVASEVLDEDEDFELSKFGISGFANDLLFVKEEEREDYIDHQDRLGNLPYGIFKTNFKEKLNERVTKLSEVLQKRVDAEALASLRKLNCPKDGIAFTTCLPKCIVIPKVVFERYELKYQGRVPVLPVDGCDIPEGAIMSPPPKMPTFSDLFKLNLYYNHVKQKSQRDLAADALGLSAGASMAGSQSTAQQDVDEEPMTYPCGDYSLQEKDLFKVELNVMASCNSIPWTFNVFTDGEDRTEKIKDKNFDELELPKFALKKPNIVWAMLQEAIAQYLYDGSFKEIRLLDGKGSIFKMKPLDKESLHYISTFVMLVYVLDHISPMPAPKDFIVNGKFTDRGELIFDSTDDSFSKGLEASEYLFNSPKHYLKDWSCNNFLGEFIDFYYHNIASLVEVEEMAKKSKK